MYFAIVLNLIDLTFFFIFSYSFLEFESSNPPHFDTAEIYKTGNPFADDDGLYNENVLSHFFASVPRDSFTVATKFMPMKYGGGAFSKLKYSCRFYFCFNSKTSIN